MNDTSIITAENAVQIPGVRATRLGLEIDENLSPEAVATVFSCIEHITGCSNWLWGDALAYAGRKWGNQFVDSKYKQAALATGLAVPTLKWTRHTAERIPMPRRRHELTFTHHAEIAFGFDDPAVQDQWLDRAVAEKWTAIQLRKAIRLSKQEIFEEPNKEAGKFAPCAAYIDLVEWLRKEDFKLWPEDQLKVWIDDLLVIQEIRQQLLTIQRQ